MEDNLVLAWLLSLVVCTTIAGAIGGNRGRQGAGLLCGLVLGPLGVIVALFLPRDGYGEPARGPGAPVRRVPVKQDPLEEFEARERAKKVLAVPEHLKGRTIEEE